MEECDAFLKTSCSWSVPLDRSALHQVPYASGRIAKICSSRSRVRVTDLESGVSTAFVTLDDDPMTHAAISSLLVVAPTESGHCYAWNLKSLKSHSRKIKDLRVYQLVISDSTIVVLYYTDALSCQDPCMTTWSIKSMRTHNFTARSYNRPNRDLRQWKILVNDTTQDVIFSERLVSDNMMVHFTRYSIDGTIRSSGKLDGLRTDRFGDVPSFAPVEAINGTATLWSYVISQREQGPGCSMWFQIWRIGRVIYDMELDRLLLQQYQLSSKNLITFRSPTDTSLYLYHDTLYLDKRLPREGTSILWLINLDSLQCKRTALKIDEAIDNRYGPVSLWGDGKNSVKITTHGYCAWSFDKNAALAKEDESFKDHMREERQKRVYRA